MLDISRNHFPEGRASPHANLAPFIGSTFGGVARTPVLRGMRCPEGTGLSGQLNPDGPYAGLTRRAGNNTSSLTTASPQVNSPTRASQGCCARMEVLGHQDPADKQAVRLLQDFFDRTSSICSGAL